MYPHDGIKPALFGWLGSIRLLPSQGTILVIDIVIVFLQILQHIESDGRPEGFVQDRWPSRQRNHFHFHRQ